MYGVAPAILKEKLDDQLGKFIRYTDYFLVSHFSCMHCGELNSAHKNF